MDSTTSNRLGMMWSWTGQGKHVHQRVTYLSSQSLTGGRRAKEKSLNSSCWWEDTVPKRLSTKCQMGGRCVKRASWLPRYDAYWWVFYGSTPYRMSFMAAKIKQPLLGRRFESDFQAKLSQYRGLPPCQVLIDPTNFYLYSSAESSKGLNPFQNAHPVLAVVKIRFWFLDCPLVVHPTVKMTDRKRLVKIYPTPI